MVIQRWQSLLLLIAVVMMGLFSFCSLGQIQGADTSFNISALGIYAEGNGTHLQQGTIYVAIVAWLTALLSLIAIFLFKNTRLQRRVCWLCIVLTLAACGSEWLAATTFEVPGSNGVSWSSMVCAPFIAIVSLLCAIRCIRSDEKKLASYDRLR